MVMRVEDPVEAFHADLVQVLEYLAAAELNGQAARAAANDVDAHQVLESKDVRSDLLKA